MITLVYDSPEAESAARILHDRLTSKRKHAVVLLDMDGYIAEGRSMDKTIIIGHDWLAEKELRRIRRLGYNQYGMSYGMNGNLCVLSAQRDLNYREQSEFLEFANNQTMIYRDQLLESLTAQNNEVPREIDMRTTAREFVDEMKDLYFDGDNSASGVAVKTGLTVAFSPLFALVGVGILVAAACEAGSAALDRKKVLETQYCLLSLEFEAYGLDRFLGQSIGVAEFKLTGRKPASRPRTACAKPLAPGLSALRELDALIGLEGVKRTIHEIITFLLKRGKNAVPCLHMVFRGNPGTAKTTVARIIARVFAEIGITDKNLLVETDRSGLIGGYIGQTALKTEKLIHKSLGGVLFIDEAYALFTDSHQDYGNEAVATLVKAMEDKRDRFVCIMAGYSKEMDDMIHMNPGLRDRVQFTIDFPDYTEQELIKIFLKFCAEYKYTLSKAAKSDLFDTFSRIVEAKGKNFSNGRLVRKIFDRVRVKQAQRTSDSVIIPEDIAAALSEPDIAVTLQGECTKIGFVV